MTYSNFEDRIVEMLKIKLTNYRMTSNDIMYLIQMVYEDISGEVNLDFYRQVMTVDSNLNLFDLNITSTNDDVIGLVVKVEDDNGLNISRMFIEVDKLVYKVNNYVCDAVDESWLYEQDGRDITFIREFAPDITQLDTKQYSLLLSAVVEGCIFHTQDALPNPTSSNSPAGETNMHAQRYYNKIQQLRNKLPQVK